ncbi:MAG: MBL fold metallo-hydrolase [Planctomycetaceae bacterium]|nr:MBL fold metallo-hydrolase [Planctomycetaceae bacterium]
MRVRMLGTGGYHPNARRHTACLLLPEIGLAFDCGSSAFRLQHEVITPELDIVLTHAHLDHICGLTYLLVPMLTKQWQTVRVHADENTLAAVKTHLFSQPVFPVLPAFEFRELAETLSVTGGILHHIPLQHPGGSRGFRLDFDDGCQLAYITDTTADGSYTDFVRGVDVLIHECYFPDELAEWCVKTGHSHTSQVAQLAKDAGVGQLYLTHIDPQRPDDDPLGLATARAIFPQTFLAEDGMEITLV